MKYPSKYSNGKTVSAAQYITEIICEHLAKKDKKDLHYRFWVSPEWQKFYKSQIFSANKLLKKYSPKAIIEALKTTTGQKIYSLRAPHLLAIIDQQERLLAAKPDPVLSVDIERNTDNIGSQNKLKTKSLIDKLKELDNAKD
jgi:hypothetical protein